MLAAALPLALVLGCAHDKLAQRTEAKELADLSARTEIFWRSIQWQDPSGAAQFIEDEGTRRTWLVEVERLVAEVRVTDASLLDMDISPVVDDAPDGHVRTASVLVRTEGFTMPAQIVKRDTVVQTWYRSADGWFLDWRDGHPLTGQPW